MACSFVRGAIGTAVACGAFMAGPLSVGVAVSNADLLGIGGGGGGVDVLGIDLLGGKNSGGPTATHTRLNAVSTAPSARSVVVRSKIQATQRDPAVAQMPTYAPVAYRPAISSGAPLLDDLPAAPPPAAPATPPVQLPQVLMPRSAPAVGIPAPQAAPITTTSRPGPSGAFGPADKFLPKTVPDTFRVGYSEYLRRANTADIVAAALPGAVGIAGFTFVGAYAGYRQARAFQQALLAPVPTSVLL